MKVIYCIIVIIVPIGAVLIVELRLPACKDTVRASYVIYQGKVVHDSSSKGSYIIDGFKSPFNQSAPVKGAIIGSGRSFSGFINSKNNVVSDQHGAFTLKIQKYHEDNKYIFIKYNDICQSRAIASINAHDSFLGLDMDEVDIIAVFHDMRGWKDAWPKPGLEIKKYREGLWNRGYIESQCSIVSESQLTVYVDESYNVILAAEYPSDPDAYMSDKIDSKSKYKKALCIEQAKKP